MGRRVRAALLQMDNLLPYERNLDLILAELDSLKGHDLVVAPEVCLTDYDYENLERAVEFSEHAEERLCDRVDRQILVLTMLRKRGGRYINEAVVIHGNRVVHRQAKHKLFTPGDEDKYLAAGGMEEIVPFEIEGVKYGLMICFELRFKEIWRRLEGCDVIVVPSQWGLPRKRHLEILAQALGVMNQCFVAVANSSRADMASSSAVYTPGGGVVRDDMSRVISADMDLDTVKKIRRYIPVR
jgi:predicted amidohydrolase